jgi:DNA polymerase V
MHEDKKPALTFFQSDPEKKLLVPYSDNGLNATFSGLFSDVAIEWIDLSPLLNTRPSSTFFCRVNGDSMQDERLLDGDIVIVDKSLPLQDGKKMVVWLAQENGWTVKRLSMKDGMLYLNPANEKLKPYLATADDIFWGVVTWILHKE